MPSEKFPHIEYHSPEEFDHEIEQPQHKFDLILEGKKVGSAEVDYFSKPIPLYQVTDLYVDFEQKGKGYASQILDQVENFLKTRRKPGVLVDAIAEGDPAQGMYARHGWQEVPGSMGLHVFNWPPNISLAILKGYTFRYTDLSERLERKLNVASLPEDYGSAPWKPTVSPNKNLRN